MSRLAIKLEARILQLEHDFAEAVDLAEEAIPYASEYFIEKWDLDGRCERLKAKIDPESDAYKTFWMSEEEKTKVDSFAKLWAARSPLDGPG